MMLEHVIFAIDNGDDLHQQAKFLRHVDTLRSMEKMMGTLYSGIGSYEGNLERCYMMSATDYDRHLANSEYLRGQGSVLRVPGDTRQPCTLHFKEGEPVSIGTMRQVTDGPIGDFTYINGKYWECDNE